jgi:nicotinate-nucleotide adenylyltransferase
VGRIGILGGTFDPVHIAHLRIAIEAYEQHNLEKVIFIPNKVPPHKPLPHFSEKKRIFFLKKVLSKYSFLDYSLIELQSDSEYSYAISTVSQLKKMYPEDEFFFIIGEDSYWNIETWHRWKELLEMCPFLVYPRGSKPESLRKFFARDKRGNFSLIEAPYLDISSRAIREKLEKRKKIDFLVPMEIEKRVQKEF